MGLLRTAIVSATVVMALATSAVAQDNPTRGERGQGGQRSWKAPNDPNASPQKTIERGAIDESSVQSLLQSKGYLDVRNLKRTGGDYTAEANKDGRNVRVKVDGRSGRIEEVSG